MSSVPVELQWCSWAIHNMARNVETRGTLRDSEVDQLGGCVPPCINHLHCGRLCILRIQHCVYARQDRWL